MPLVAAACSLQVDLGDTATAQYELADFDAVRVDAPFTVTIRQGTTQSVEIEAGENVLDDITVEVQDGELLLDLDGGLFGWNGDVEARITVVDLDSLDLSGASSTALPAVDVDDLIIDIDGASSIEAAGTIDHLDLRVSGASDVDLVGTSIGSVDIDAGGASSIQFDRDVADIEGTLSGASDLSVDAATNVRVDTSGASNIDRD